MLRTELKRSGTTARGTHSPWLSQAWLRLARLARLGSEGLANSALLPAEHAERGQLRSRRKVTESSAR